MAEISQVSVVSFISSFAVITILNPTGEWKWSVCPSLCPPLRTGRGRVAGGVGRKACYALFWQKKKKKSSWRILWQWNKLHLSRIPKAKVDFCCISSEIGHDNVSLGLIFPNTDNPQRPVLEEICFSLFSKFKSFPIQWYGVLYILIFSSCHGSSKLSYIQNVS